MNAQRGLTRGAATRQKVILAAAKILSEKGYSATKLECIATEAGTKAGSLYYHFASRDDLIREVLAACMAMISDDVESALAEVPEGSPFADVLRIGIGAHLRAILSDRPFMAAYNRIINEVPEHIRQEYVAAPRRYGQRWHEIIVAAQASGELRRDLDATLFRLLLFGAVTWAQVWFRKDGGKSIDELTEHVVDIFLHGAQANG